MLVIKQAYGALRVLLCEAILMKQKLHGLKCEVGLKHHRLIEAGGSAGKSNHFMV